MTDKRNTSKALAQSFISSRHGRRAHACTPCSRRKTKCDGEAPCNNCVVRGDISLCSYERRDYRTIKADYTKALEQRVAELEKQLENTIAHLNTGHHHSQQQVNPHSGVNNHYLTATNHPSSTSTNDLNKIDGNRDSRNGNHSQHEYNHHHHQNQRDSSTSASSPQSALIVLSENSTPMTPQQNGQITISSLLEDPQHQKDTETGNENQSDSPYSGPDRWLFPTLRHDDVLSCLQSIDLSDDVAIFPCFTQGELRVFLYFYFKYYGLQSLAIVHPLWLTLNVKNIDKMLLHSMFALGSQLVALLVPSNITPNHSIIHQKCSEYINTALDKPSFQTITALCALVAYGLKTDTPTRTRLLRSLAGRMVLDIELNHEKDSRINQIGMNGWIITESLRRCFYCNVIADQFARCALRSTRIIPDREFCPGLPTYSEYWLSWTPNSPPPPQQPDIFNLLSTSTRVIPIVHGISEFGYSILLWKLFDKLSDLAERCKQSCATSEYCNTAYTQYPISHPSNSFDQEFLDLDTSLDNWTLARPHFYSNLVMSEARNVFDGAQFILFCGMKIWLHRLKGLTTSVGVHLAELVTDVITLWIGGDFSALRPGPIFDSKSPNATTNSYLEGPVHLYCRTYCCAAFALFQIGHVLVERLANPHLTLSIRKDLSQRLSLISGSLDLIAAYNEQGKSVADNFHSMVDSLMHHRPIEVQESTCTG